MSDSQPPEDDIAPLLRIGLDDDVDPDATILVTAPTPRTGSSTAGGARGWQPPTLEELQQMLPQYEISAFIARGGMGAVYKGAQKTLKRPVAIKVLPPDLEDGDLQFAARFKHEAQAMAQLSHPNIVAVFDAGEAPGGLLYFVMEYIEGTDVAQLIASEGIIEPRRAIQITTAVCEALAFAHEEGIIHRDIKPSNIMLDRRGRVKVADFGLAKTVNVETALLTGTHMAMGTPDFIAPEALIRGMKVDQRVDIYAVGVMLYQMLTGHIPRGRFELPSGVIPQMDKGFDAIVDKAMQTDREKRYSTALEMKTDVERVGSSGFSPSLVGSSGFSPSGSVLPDGLKPELRTKSRKPLLLGVAATLIIGTIAWLFLNEPSEAEGISSPSPQASQSARLSDRDAALKVLAKGASVTIRTSAGATEKVTTAAALPAEAFELEGVETAQLSKTFDDETMAAMAGLPKLRKVKLTETSITGKGLQVVTTLPALRTLSLDWNMKLKDADLALLRKCPLLEEFALWHPEMFTPAALEHVSHLTNLTKLDLMDFSLRPEDVRPLLQLRKLVFLALGGTRMDAAMLEQLCQLPELLDLRFTLPQGGGRVDFSSFPKLKRVGLFEGITVGLVESLVSLKGLEGLTISVPGKLDASVISKIAQSLKGLTSLSLTLDQSLVGAAPLSPLSALPKLTYLTVGNHGAINQFNDAALLSLEGVTALKSIKIDTLKHRMTREGIADFQKRRPDVKLEGMGLAAATPSLEARAIRLWDTADKIPVAKDIRWEEEAMRLVGANCSSGPESRNAILRASVRAATPTDPKGASAVLALRKNDSSAINYARLALNLATGKASFSTATSGVAVHEWSLPRTYRADEWVQVELRAIGDDFTVLVDGQVIGTAHNETLSSPGKAMLFAGSNGALFRNIVYIPLDGLSEVEALKAAGAVAPDAARQ